MTIFSKQNTGLQQETPSQHCDCLCLWQLHSKTLLFYNRCFMFSIAGGAVTEVMIASVFDHALEKLGAISESGNILLNGREVQSTVL